MPLRSSRWPVLAAGIVAVAAGGASVAPKSPPATLRVAVLNEYPWLKERHGPGEPFEGPAWLIAREAARRLHARLVTMRVGFADKLAVLDRGQVDATIAPLLVTPDRASRYGIVRYSRAAQCLFGRADDPKLRDVRRLDELNRPGVTIATVHGSPQGDWLRRRLPSARTVEVPGNITTVASEAVLTRRADVATIDQFFFAGLARRDPVLRSLPFGTSCLDSREFRLPIGLAVRRDDRRLERLFEDIVARQRSRLLQEQHRVVAAGAR